MIENRLSLNGFTLWWVIAFFSRGQLNPALNQSEEEKTGDVFSVSVARPDQTKAGKQILLRCGQTFGR